MNMHVSFLEPGERWLDVTEEYHTLSMIAKSVRDNDKGLFASKWFDYRFMTSFQATMRYMRDFEVVSRRIYRREIDMRRSNHIQILTPEKMRRELDKGTMDVILKSRLTGFWRGRQVADALGMPYPEYIELALTDRMRAWQRTYLPKPEQLYDMVMVEKIQTKWQEMKAARTYLPEHHAFMVQNYANLPVQNDFHEYLFEQATTGGDQFFQIARFIREDFLPYEKARNRLTDAEFARVQEHL